MFTEQVVQRNHKWETRIKMVLEVIETRQGERGYNQEGYSDMEKSRASWVRLKSH